MHNAALKGLLFLPAHQVEKGLVDAGVRCEFGMECCGHGSSLPDHYGVVAFRGENFHAFADVFDLGGADEDHFDRRFAEGGIVRSPDWLRERSLPSRMELSIWRP